MRRNNQEHREIDKKSNVQSDMRSSKRINELENVEPDKSQNMQPAHSGADENKCDSGHPIRDEEVQFDVKCSDKSCDDSDGSSSEELNQPSAGSDGFLDELTSLIREIKSAKDEMNEVIGRLRLLAERRIASALSSTTEAFRATVHQRSTSAMAVIDRAR